MPGNRASTQSDESGVQSLGYSRINISIFT
jgi:hypothetical protein